MCRHGSTEQEACQRAGGRNLPLSGTRPRPSQWAASESPRAAQIRPAAPARVRTGVLAERAFRRLVVTENHDEHATIRVAALRPCHCSAPDGILRGRSRRAAPDPRRALANRCTTLAARAADSSQFDGNVVVLIGRLSVWPSTRTGFGYLASVSARALSGGNAPRTASRRRSRNRMSVRISTSTQVDSTAHRDQVGSRPAAASAFSTSSATRASCRRHDDLVAGAGLLAAACGCPCRAAHRAEIASSIWRGCPSMMACCTIETAMSAPEPRVFSPTWIGSSVLGAPRNAALQRIREHAELALVDRGDRVHHHEEREQQRDQVAIGNGPRLVVDVLFVFVLAAIENGVSPFPGNGA